MTIKKRLFISNVLMIVIPIIVTIATIFVCALIFNTITGGALIEIIKAEREMQDVHSYSAENRAQIVMLSFLIFAAIIAVLYFTNRFLTKFVFRKIEQPLKMLGDGVRQIHGGNLNNRLVYYEDDEFKPIFEDFNEMAARLKDSVEQTQKNEQNRKELLAGISHDLRSPLTSIKAFVEGLLDGVAKTPEAQKEYLEIIKQKTDDINSMVSQLFLYSKMDMGNYPTNPERLDIGEEISGFVIATSEEYSVKALTVKILDIPINKYVYADPLQLRSVFANILDNSAKYKINDTATATISCKAENSVIEIVFEDDGAGVADDALSKLFDVFYRGDPSRSNPQQGSGLGLAIAAKALERCNGSIRAENCEEGGLRMTIEIPEMTGGQMK